MSFDYEITVVKAHPEISVVSPLLGEITGKRTTELEFSYTPKTFATAEAQVSIRTTEFDAEPKLIRIVGNAAPAKSATSIDHSKTVLAEEQTRSFAVDSKTLLTSHKNPQTRLKKLTNTAQKQDASVAEEPVTQKSSMVDIKTVKLSEEEQCFIRSYRQIEEVEREKGIKFFRCIGDEPHTEVFVEEVG